ncbi:hypothetical protein B6S44_07755 [Bosea sp. Tri-44]|nr:hypothetical protein B6S44_07755 [Bosea sp. Tri-44]
MIVCSCNVLSEQDVRSAVEAQTPRSPSQVYGCLGCSAKCGRCARTIRRLMDEALGGAQYPATAARGPHSPDLQPPAGVPGVKPLWRPVLLFVVKVGPEAGDRVFGHEASIGYGSSVEHLSPSTEYTIPTTS